MTEYDWRTVDFRPVAVSGWRALFLDDPTGRVIDPLAGWLIQEEVERNDWGGAGTPTGSRRVIAAVRSEWEAEPVTAAANFWCVLAPGELEPTTAEEVAERERQAERYRRASRRNP